MSFGTRLGIKRFDFSEAGRKECPEGYYVFAQDYIDLLHASQAVLRASITDSVDLQERMAWLNMICLRASSPNATAESPK